jgi:hypothetical protein
MSRKPFKNVIKIGSINGTLDLDNISIAFIALFPKCQILKALKILGPYILVADEAR